MNLVVRGFDSMPNFTILPSATLVKEKFEGKNGNKELDTKLSVAPVSISAMVSLISLLKQIDKFMQK